MDWQRKILLQPLGDLHTTDYPPGSSQRSDRYTTRGYNLSARPPKSAHINPAPLETAHKK